jgi:hypothetical protein
MNMTTKQMNDTFDAIRVKHGRAPTGAEVLHGFVDAMDNIQVAACEKMITAVDKGDMKTADAAAVFVELLGMILDEVTTRAANITADLLRGAHQDEDTTVRTAVSELDGAPTPNNPIWHEETPADALNV